MMFLSRLGIAIMKIKLFLIVSLVHMSLLSQAQALVIGTIPNNPPMSSFADKNKHFFGFEIDIMQAICQRIKTRCTFVPVVMKNIRNDLMTQKIDLAIAGYIFSDKPPPGFILSLPYLPSSGQFMVESDSRITTTTDLEHKMIGVRHGTLFNDLLTKLHGSKASMTKYDTIGDLLIALKNQDVDAVLINAVAANYWEINGGRQYKTVGNRIPIGNGYGILANMWQVDLMARVNMALQGMMADGSYTKLYSLYF